MISANEARAVALTQAPINNKVLNIVFAKAENYIRDAAAAGHMSVVLESCHHVLFSSGPSCHQYGLTYCAFKWAMEAKGFNITFHKNQGQYPYTYTQISWELSEQEQDS